MVNRNFYFHRSQYYKIIFCANVNRQIRVLPSEYKTLNSISRLIFVSKVIGKHSSGYIWEEGENGDSEQKRRYSSLYGKILSLICVTNGKLLHLESKLEITL